MERIILILPFLCFAVMGDIGKHYYIHEDKNWNEARSYCKEMHTDLSIVGSQEEQEKLIVAAGEKHRDGWIGLHKNSASGEWTWLDGGAVTYTNWSVNQPDNFDGQENAVQLFNDGYWNDENMDTKLHFYCIDVTVVEVPKSWEDALEYCRKNYTDLATLQSQAEHFLGQSAIQQAHITDPVWIGLRYLGDRWMWMNNEPLVYEGWPQGGSQNHQCPAQKQCGALSKVNVWVNWDCQEELNFICI